MAKTRAQRKAERRRRQQQAERQRGDGGERMGGRDDDARARDSATREAGGGATRDTQDRARHDTQVPRSGEAAEFEAVLETGARTEDFGERTIERDEEATDQSGSPVPGVVPDAIRPEAPAPEPPTPAPPAPSRADVGRPGDEVAEAPPRETREQRRARKRREKEERRKARARELQREQAAKAEKRRGPVIGFLASCWAELKRVQWPDRDTLVQASAVTLIFVALMAAYLGALDGAFNWVIKQII